MLELEFETLNCLVLMRLRKTFYSLLWTDTSRAIRAVPATE